MRNRERRISLDEVSVEHVVVVERVCREVFTIVPVYDLGCSGNEREPVFVELEEFRDTADMELSIFSHDLMSEMGVDTATSGQHVASVLKRRKDKVSFCCYASILVCTYISYMCLCRCVRYNGFCVKISFRL